MQQFKTPILIIGYNRPDKIANLIKVISILKPAIVFYAVDGPKNEYDRTNVIKTKEMVKQINWEAKIHTKFEKTNIGCRKNVSSSIDWFLTHNDQGIILEDDIVPNLSFFNYCSELLTRYKDKHNIFTISGCNVFEKQFNTYQDSYFFSRFVSVWGWATWKRAWMEYRKFEDRAAQNINEIKSQLILSASNGYANECLNTLKGKIDTWDYIWGGTILTKGGLNVIPKFNLIRNQGFGKEATHTKLYSQYARLTVSEMPFPLIHPNSVDESVKYKQLYINSRSRIALLYSIFGGILAKIFNK